MTHQAKSTKTRSKDLELDGRRSHGAYSVIPSTPQVQVKNEMSAFLDRPFVCLALLASRLDFRKPSQVGAQVRPFCPAVCSIDGGWTDEPFGLRSRTRRT
jgi:hypothetical protein